MFATTYRFSDLRRRSLRGNGRALREVSNLICDHGETQPRLTGAGGLHRRVQRKEVGLKGDLIDGFYYLGYL